MKEEMKKAIKEMQEAIAECELEIDDVSLLKEAMINYRAGIGRNYRAEEEQKPTSMASDKQKSYLKKLGYKGDVEKLTSLEASALITTLKEEIAGY